MICEVLQSFLLVIIAICIYHGWPHEHIDCQYLYTQCWSLHTPRWLILKPATLLNFRGAFGQKITIIHVITHTVQTEIVSQDLLRTK